MGGSFLSFFDRAAAERMAKWMSVDMSTTVGGMPRGEETRLMLIM